ncbi:MAG TPA: preQ(1) synthase, partial [Gaiellaceae bacterium]|nr:preQ(1) synthase [Gaiellaceae bacterium]
ANPQADVLYLARFTAPEFTSLCPVTGQPDFAHLVIDYAPGDWLVESKSLKLYLSRYREQGAFCEALAVQIRDDVAEALRLGADAVHVTLRQKARGGITITASV